MAAPTLDSEQPGLRVLAEVAGLLGSITISEEALGAAAGALRRGLGLRRVRLWVRNPAGVGYHAVAVPGEAAPSPQEFDPPAAGREWYRAGPQRTISATGAQWRFPLLHEDEALGMLEVGLHPGRPEPAVHDVALVVAQILAPVIAATELSQDLASEVALRTREVEAQRNFAARIIDSLPVGLYVIDRSYLIRAWNRKRESGTQGVARDDAVGREIFDVLDRQPRDLLKREFDRVFDSGEIQQVEMESQASGEARFYRITKIPMRLDDENISHVITIGEDVTDWRQAQHRLAQTEKLAAVGQLAAGVMHEINNPLATISACSEALDLRLESLAPADRQASEEYLKIIDTEVQRCRRIVDGLLDFSRPKTGQKQEVDINAVIDQTLFLLKHHERFKRMTVARELADALPRLRGDPERLIQAFMALLLNGMDAMNSRGVLTVRSRRNPERRDELLLEFIDTGAGIRQEELSKIFEPFFTTKPQGRGTGLGLSVCYGIVADHRGRIEVESTVGEGSTFKVFLPVG
jgi:two-component system, NtrC family, sensor kinase